MSIIIGIDPSLTGTAICAYKPFSSVSPTARMARYSSEPSHSFQERMQRFQILVNSIGIFLSDYLIDREFLTVFIEGYSFGSKGRAVYDIAEYGGILRNKLWMEGLQVVEVPPMTLKKFATGKHMADKTMMALHAFKRWGVEYGTSDEIDAYCLCRLGECYLELQGCDTDFQREAIAALKGEKPPKKKRAKKAS